MCKSNRQNDSRGRGEWQGMNWIRQDKRLAIYLRDGLACAYCGHAAEEGAQLTLDHLKPHSKGGSNDETNLVTCCGKCNSSRGNRSVRGFCRAVAEYTESDAAAIERHVRRQARRDLRQYRIEAKEMISRRGSAARVIEAM